MGLSPLDRYRRLVDSGDFLPDPEQLRAAHALDDLWHDLQRRAADEGLIRRLRRRRGEPVRGLYLWGGVGRGKTWLMDLFYDSLDFEARQRIHFHRFMQRVHSALRAQGTARDPLPRIARSWAERCRVLCLDEFFVSDIADAMLLGGLLGREESPEMIGEIEALHI